MQQPLSANPPPASSSTHHTLLHPPTHPPLATALIIQSDVIGAFKKGDKQDYAVNYRGLWTQIWRQAEQGDGWMFGRMKDDELKKAALLPLSSSPFIHAVTDLWDKEEEDFVDSISLRNSQAFSEEEKGVTVTYVLNSSSLLLPVCV